jgi:hypothetical protein
LRPHLAKREVMTLAKPFTLLAVVSVLGLTAACSHDDYPAQTTTSSAPVSRSSISRIVTATCAKAQQCNDVGVDRKYATDEVCSEKNFADRQNDLTNANCPTGIDEARVERCVADIRAASCGNLIDRFQTSSACSKSTLCHQ